MCINVLFLLCMYQHLYCCIGFLPCFGPSYVNIYGPPNQKFSVFPDKYDDMNSGKVLLYLNSNFN